MVGKAEMGFVHAEVDPKMIGFIVMIRFIQAAKPQLRKADNREGRQDYNTIYYFSPQ